MPEIRWTENDEERSAPLRRAGGPPPARTVTVDDRVTADTAYRLACQGTALLWRGDFHNARRLLDAMTRRARRRRGPPASSPARAFHLHRRARSRRAQILGLLMVPLDAAYGIPLRRAPDVRQACTQAFGPASGPSVTPLRELLGVIGAHQWRMRGVEVPALGSRIHPHYGVFAPIRGEYVDLVARAPLPSRTRAFDIGTGTGVLAAVLARRGVEHLVATDDDPRSLVCARDNLHRLGLAGRIDVRDADLFPPGRAPLIVCNPPWIPATPVTPLDHAVYDPGGRTLHGFLHGLGDHLEPGGEGWLILSDLAEHLTLRTRAELLETVRDAGLHVVDRLETRPRHPRAHDETDPLHAARTAEVTSLWRLTPDPGGKPDAPG